MRAPHTVLHQAKELIQQQELEDAVQLLQKALAEFPEFAELWFLLGSAYEDLGSNISAYPCYKQAVELAPDDADSWFGLGRALDKTNRNKASEIALERCLAMRPDNARALERLAWVRLKMGNSKGGLSACERAIALDPEWDLVFYTKGSLHQLSGNLDKAREAYLHASELNPKMINPLLALADISHGTQLDDLLEKLNALQLDKIRNPMERSDILFAIARVRRTRKHYDEAFECYRQANDLVKQLHPFDKDRCRADIDEIIATFAPDLFNEIRAGGSDSRRPIFIVGMPRSGTSLTEQIISSHSAVYGAGEHPALKEIADSLSIVRDGDISYPRDVAKIEPHGLASLARQYLSNIERDCPAEASRFTDKLVFNFLNLGLIALLFPNASIIHCRRDPMDTCLSCYFQRFSDARHISYTLDLDALGFYYRQYDRLMAHWRQVLPIPVLDVDYEKLIADQEVESRRIVDFLGLEWEDACLNYYEQEREVVTASVLQVRKPIYKTSIDRWRRYEKHLGPLQDALGDLA